METYETYLVTEAKGDKYQCPCGWIYDPAKSGKEFSKEPSSFKCPKCGAGKSAFKKYTPAKFGRN